MPRGAGGEAPRGAAALEFERVSFSYVRREGGERDEVEVLRDITLRVESGERLGLLGPNGAGKTTLIKLALGLLCPSSGEVRVFGEAPERARRRGLIGYVPQRNEAELAFPLSVRQVVELGAGARLWGGAGLSSEARRRCAEALEVVDAAALAERSIGRLSGGQVQRVLIARALVSAPRVLLLDEPTVGIDAVGQRQFATLLADLHRRMGMTIVVVSHDIRAIAAGCDRVACLSRTLHAHVSPSGLTPQVLAEVFRHEVEGVFGTLHVDAHHAAGCAGHRGGNSSGVVSGDAAAPGDAPREARP